MTEGEKAMNGRWRNSDTKQGGMFLSHMQHKAASLADLTAVLLMPSLPVRPGVCKLAMVPATAHT